MAKKNAQLNFRNRYAEFRFSVVGQLLAEPPQNGNLKQRILELTQKTWRDPLNGADLILSFSTIERWYYQAKKAGGKLGPIDLLGRKSRSDLGGKRILNEALGLWLRKNYEAYGHWSVKLHFDNLKVWMETNASLAETKPSYSTVLRYMRANNFQKMPAPRSPNSPGYIKAQQRKFQYEVRSYESEYVGGLWHLDFHHCSRQICKQDGSMATPLALAIIDDHSRLCCHIQWFLNEDTQALVHGFVQALQKRGLPRALLSDNGSAMISREFKEGLQRLSIVHETTLPFSPYQNGKQESFWGQVEGRLMAMLAKKADLILEKLNSYTQAWVELEYNKALHSETKVSPYERFLKSKDVSRQALTFEELIKCFRKDETRTQRRSDGTVSILGRRYEIPNAYQTLKTVVVRFADWDLRTVHLVDPRTGQELVPIYPVNLTKNSEGQRKERHVENKSVKTNEEVSYQEPPLLKKLILEYSATGLPMAYIPEQRQENKTKLENTEVIIKKEN